MDQNRLERRLRISGILVLAGLGVELVTLFWSHPTAFLLFMFLGGLLIFLGVVIYLLALLRAGQPTKPEATHQ
jgi:predicted membrane channel-forming protein YqfA (hemolysin III family)